MHVNLPMDDNVFYDFERVGYRFDIMSFSHKFVE
jgi:hypothetical protein